MRFDYVFAVLRKDKPSYEPSPKSLLWCRAVPSVDR
jgi:hypothetical protein